MHQPTFTRAFKAEAAIHARRIVKLGASNGDALCANVASATTIAARPIGVAAELDVPEGVTVDVHLAGIADCIAGAAVTRGSSVKADAQGRAIATTTAADFVVGIALAEATAAGDIIPVLIAPQRI